MDLQGRVAIVTGGAAGAGLTMAQRLAGEGVTVVVADVDDRTGHAAIGAIGEGGGAASFVRGDVRVTGDVEHMVGSPRSATRRRHPRQQRRRLGADGELPLRQRAQWGSALDLNLRAPMLATQLVLEPMRRHGGGAVVNVASTGGLGLAPYESPEYGAAKAGLIRFTACMAYAREDTGVRVNCVVPDWIATDRALGELRGDDARAARRRGAARRPGDLADAIVELVRDESLAGRVMLLPRGEPRRLLDAI